MVEAVQVGASPRRIAVAVAAIALLSSLGCHRAMWHSEVYSHATFSDVFDIAYFTIDEDFEVERSDPDLGLIEGAWAYDAFVPQTRMPARERVVAEVVAVDEGVQLKVRMQRQTRDNRVGYNAYDDDDMEDWADTSDNFERAAIVFQKIRSSLVESGPSASFLSGSSGFRQR